MPFSLDTDFSDGRVGITAGLAPADYLDNTARGERHVSSTGAIQDCVYWGTGSAPSGAQGGNWPTGEYVDISFGGKSVNEGDSIGRPANPLENYTGTRADWDRNGGRNAAGPTPGGRNGVYPVDVLEMLMHSQTGVNQVLAGIGQTERPEWIEIVNAHVYDMSVVYSSTGFQVDATHVFELILRGELVTIAGELSSILGKNETPGSVGYTLTTTGTLKSVRDIGADADGRHSFEIEHSEALSGFQTDVIHCAASTDLTYTDSSGIQYPVSVDVDFSIARTGQDSWLSVDTRNVTDYGGAGAKSSTAAQSYSRFADGIYLSNFGVSRSRPIMPPSLAQAGSQQLMGTEQLLIDSASMTNDEGETTLGLVTRLDRFVNNSSFPSAWLKPGQFGSFSSIFTAGARGREDQHVMTQVLLPMMLHGVDTPIDGKVVESTYRWSGKRIAEGYSSVRFGQNEVLHGAAYMDPPAQVGCPHCYSCRKGIIHIHMGCDICPPPPPPPQPPAPPPAPPPPPPKDRTPMGFFGAVGACATAGAIILTIIPVAGTAAGGISGGIHCGFLYLIGVD